MHKIYEQAISAAITAGLKILEIYKRDDFEISKKEDESPLTLADRAAHKIIVKGIEDTGIPILSEEGKQLPYEQRKEWQEFWLVDPLDGTKEFIKKNGEFTVNIALIKGSSPLFGVVYAPVLKTLYVGIAGEGSWMLNDISKPVDFAEVILQKNRLEKKANNIPYRVVASRSHLNEDTEKYLEELRKKKGEIDLASRGSSLKICMVATGEADEYPRLGPTMEWDVAAAHAVVLGAGKSITIFGEDKALQYNKENLLNPYFLVK